MPSIGAQGYTGVLGHRPGASLQPLSGGYVGWPPSLLESHCNGQETTTAHGPPESRRWHLFVTRDPLPKGGVIHSTPYCGCTFHPSEGKGWPKQKPSPLRARSACINGEEGDTHLWRAIQLCSGWERYHSGGQVEYTCPQRRIHSHKTQNGTGKSVPNLTGAVHFIWPPAHRCGRARYLRPYHALQIKWVRGLSSARHITEYRSPRTF